MKKLFFGVGLGIILSSLLLSGYVSVAAVAGTYYVSTSGNDTTNTGGFGSPFKTLTRAAQLFTSPIATPGASIHINVEAGTYSSDAVNTTVHGLTEVVWEGVGAVIIQPKISSQTDLWTMTNNTTPIIVKNITFQSTSTDIVTPIELVRLQNNASSIQMLNCEVKTMAPATALVNLVNLINSPNVSFQNCQFHGCTNVNVMGLQLDKESAGVLINASKIYQTLNAITANNTPGLVISNSWIKNNGVGVWLNSCQDAVVMNNLIESNGYGLDIREACLGSVIFNNYIQNNLTAQIRTNYSPLRDDTTYMAKPSWRSGYNLIANSSIQKFAELLATSTHPIPIINNNLKTWFETTGQDVLGQSLSYFESMMTPPTPNTDSAAWEHGTSLFQGKPATTVDMNGAVRPQGKYDMGCVEAPVTGALPLHILKWSAPNPAVALPRATIQVTLTLRNAAGMPYLGNLTYPIYLYLQAGRSTSVDIKGQMTGITSNLITISPGLYKIEPTSLVNGQFTVNVTRDESNNDALAGPLRGVVWANWTADRAYGGKADDGTTLLRWTNAANDQKSQVCATTPVLATRMDPSLVCIRVKDVNDSPITGLIGADFSLDVPNAHTIDLNTLIEDSSQPGVYYIWVHSHVAGSATVTVTVRGVTLAQKPVIDFQPGVYGDVSDQGTMLTGIRVWLVDPNGKTVDETSSNWGAYHFHVLQPLSGQYTVFAESANYPRQNRLVSLVSTTAVRQDIALSGSAPVVTQGTSFPNPVHRGSNVTLSYTASESGHLVIEVYDLQGRKIATVFDQDVPLGKSNAVWNTNNSAGKSIAPGTYLALFRMNQKVEKSKLVIAP